MGHGALAVGMKLLVEVAEKEAGAEAGLPGVGIHLEAVELDQVDHDTASIATETEVAVTRLVDLVQDRCQNKSRYIRVGVAARLGLDVDAVGNSALDGVGDILSSGRANDGNGRDGDVKVVRLDPRAGVKGSIGVGNAVALALADGVEARLQGGARSVTHIEIVKPAENI